MSILFAVAAVVSLILVIPEINNYIEFYKGIQNFQILLESITINNTRIDEGQVFIMVNFEATNPSGFVGLTISSVTCQLKYVKDGLLQSLAGITQTFSPPTEVNPPQSVIVCVDFDLEYKGHDNLIRNFIGYLQTNPEKMDWIVTGQFIIRAYADVFPIQIGPFQHSTYLH